MKVEWIDRGREPMSASDPRFPNGQDNDISRGAERSCYQELPYPAKRCGLYIVECERCGYRAAITTAGRPDDPRSIRIPCKPIPN